MCLLAAGVVFAADVWDQESKAWDKKDVDKILNNSPWAKRVATKVERTKDDAKANATQSSVNQYDRGDLKEGDFAVIWWWSAHTPRRAYLRFYELAGNSVTPEQTENFSESKMPSHSISMMGGGTQTDLAGRMPEEALKKSVWLISARLKKALEPAEVEVVKLPNGKIDRILFHFAQQVDGQPLITNEDKKITFRWKLPKNPKQKPEEFEAFEAAFEPKRMQARGANDY
jgi:hypothetical protein